jgi:hypothetical protein
MEEELDLKHLERLRTLLDILSNGPRGTGPMSTVVKRMHEALASLESFPVTFSPNPVNSSISSLRGLGGRSLLSYAGKPFAYRCPPTSKLCSASCLWCLLLVGYEFLIDCTVPCRMQSALRKEGNKHSVCTQMLLLKSASHLQRGSPSMPAHGLGLLCNPMWHYILRTHACSWYRWSAGDSACWQLGLLCCVHQNHDCLRSGRRRGAGWQRRWVIIRRCVPGRPIEAAAYTGSL